MCFQNKKKCLAFCEQVALSYFWMRVEGYCAEEEEECTWIFGPSSNN